MHSEIHLLLHHIRAVELRAEADVYRLAAATRDLRTRLGWALVEVGLRLAAAPRTAIAAH